MLSTILVLIALGAIIYAGTYIIKYILGQSDTLLFNNFPRTDVPYVTINVQGLSLNMIVDTGCGISIISKDALNNLKYEESPRKIHLNSLTPDSLASEVVTIPLNVGSKSIKEDFAVYSQKDIACFGANYGVIMHGLLGNEFFAKTKCKIDFKKNSLIIP